MKRGITIASLGMVGAVATSNYLVELPINEWLNWGAFSYPVTFFITEVTNFYYGSKWARRVVYIGFIVAAFISYILVNPQIALASGMAFLIGQLLDISVFMRLRQKAWWLAPAGASVTGSIVDTLVFYSIAFYGQGWLIITMGTGDFLVKLGMDLLMLLPFRIMLWRQPKVIYI